MLICTGIGYLIYRMRIPMSLIVSRQHDVASHKSTSSVRVIESEASPHIHGFSSPLQEVVVSQTIPQEKVAVARM